MIFLVFLSFFSSWCDRGIQLLKPFGNCFSVWPELSELPLVVISHYGYEKGRQLTAFVCLVEFLSVMLLYLFIPVSYLFCKWFLVCFFPDFIHHELRDLQKEKKSLCTKATSAVCLEESGRALCRKEWKIIFDSSQG